MSEFNPSSREKPKKEVDVGENPPIKHTQKVDEGRERREKFNKVWKRFLRGSLGLLRVFYRITLANNEIVPASCAYGLMFLVGLFIFANFPAILLIAYVGSVLIVNLIFRYYYPENFKRKRK